MLQRKGFTLVELLVVVAVVALVCCLVLPRMNYSSRDPSRRAHCLNNIRCVGMASADYEAKKGRFPGYFNPKLNAGAPYNTSWYIAIMSHMGRETAYRTWIDQPIGESPYLEIYFCPSDSTGGNRDLPVVSYVLNTGKPGNTVSSTANPKYDGVCHDLSDKSLLLERGLSTKDIIDGLDVTILASENLDADQYLPQSNDPEDVFGISWGGPQFAINQSPTNSRRTNFTTQDFRYARPSSNHGGVVNVVFAATNTRSIDEAIDPKVWNALMTPNGQQLEPQLQTTPRDGNY